MTNMIQSSNCSNTGKWRYFCPFTSAKLLTKDMVEVGWMVLVTLLKLEGCVSVHFSVVFFKESSLMFD